MLDLVVWCSVTLLLHKVQGMILSIPRHYLYQGTWILFVFNFTYLIKHSVCRSEQLFKTFGDFWTLSCCLSFSFKMEQGVEAWPAFYSFACYQNAEIRTFFSWIDYFHYVHSINSLFWVFDLPYDSCNRHEPICFFHDWHKYWLNDPHIFCTLHFVGLFCLLLSVFT